MRVNRGDIQTNGYKSLEPGERVSFDIQLDRSVEEGVRAVKVTPLGDFAPVPEVSHRPLATMPAWLGCCIGLLAAAALVAYGVWLVRAVVADIDW